MSSTGFTTTVLDHPGKSELAVALAEFCSALPQGRLHRAALDGLTGGDGLGIREPFPKVESHDSYLYGVLTTPTDITDGRSIHFNVHFVIHETAALAVVWGPRDGVEGRSRDLVRRFREGINDMPEPENPGDAIVRIAQVIVEDLQDLLDRIHESIDTQLDLVENAIFQRNYQSLSDNTNLTYRDLSRLKFEIISIAPTISETKNFFASIEAGTVVIRPPFTAMKDGIPPFASNHRIWFNDLHMKARSLKAQRTGLENEVRLLFDRLTSLEDRRQTVAQMRFAAVASILLLPALIVGYFGQNFKSMGILGEWWTPGLSGIVLAVITVFQYTFFKVKKWL